jgi:8-oxo-dGTP pyrophosphatase MutT (NUDIX family)
MDPSGAPRNVTAATQPVFRGARVAIIARDLTGSPYLLVQCEQGLDEKRKMRRKWTTQGGAVDEKDYDPDEEEFFKNAAVREAFEETRGIVRLERDRLELINRIEMPNPILKYRGEILKRRTYVCVLEPGSCEYISQQIRAGLISGVREGKGTVIVEHKLVALEMIVGGAEGFRFRGYHHRPTWPFGHHGAETFNALRRLHMLWEREKQDIIEEPVAERMALFLEEVALWGSL